MEGGTALRCDELVGSGVLACVGSCDDGACGRIGCRILVQRRTRELSHHACPAPFSVDGHELAEPGVRTNLRIQLARVCD